MGEVEVLKGHTEKVIIKTWVGGRGTTARCLVSVGTFFLHSTGKYLPTGKSFALSSAEAREVAAALLVVADQVDRGNVDIEEAAIQEGRA